MSVISMNRVFGSIGEKYVGFHYHIQDNNQRANAIKNVAYRIQVIVFCTATLFGVAALVSALFLKLTTALTFTGVSILLRSLVSRDLEGVKAAHGGVFAYLGIRGHADWNPDRWTLSLVDEARATPNDRWVLWKRFPPIGPADYLPAQG